jgi:hypothetical protein
MKYARLCQLCHDHDISTLVKQAGETITVTFQKNLDHWVKATPGNFKISLMMDGNSTSMASAMLNDMGEPSLHLYSTTLMVPMSAMEGKYMIQVVYNTMNPIIEPARQMLTLVSNMKFKIVDTRSTFSCSPSLNNKWMQS